MHDLSPIPSFTSEAKVRYLIAELEWQDVWLPAAKKYMFQKRGSAIDLAHRLKITRQLAADKRPLAKLSPAERIIRGAHVKLRQELDEMWKQATETREGKDFFHRLYKGSKIPARKITRPLNTYGAVVLAADKLFRKLRRKPTRKEIQKKVNRWRWDGGLGYHLISDKQWNRIFSDPLIAALIQND